MARNGGRKESSYLFFTFFLVGSHSDNPQPATANTSHTIPVIMLYGAKQEGDLLLPSSGLQGKLQPVAHNLS